MDTFNLYIVTLQGPTHIGQGTLIDLPNIGQAFIDRDDNLMQHWCRDDSFMVAKSVGTGYYAVADVSSDTWDEDVIGDFVITYLGSRPGMPCRFNLPGW